MFPAMGQAYAKALRWREDALWELFLSKPFDGDTQVQTVSESQGLLSVPRECLRCSVHGAFQALRGISLGPNPGLTSSLPLLKGS